MKKRNVTLKTILSNYIFNYVLFNYIFSIVLSLLIGIVSNIAKIDTTTTIYQLTTKGITSVLSLCFILFISPKILDRIFKKYTYPKEKQPKFNKCINIFAIILVSLSLLSSVFNIIVLNSAFNVGKANYIANYSQTQISADMDEKSSQNVIDVLESNLSGKKTALDQNLIGNFIICIVYNVLFIILYTKLTKKYLEKNSDQITSDNKIDNTLDKKFVEGDSLALKAFGNSILYFLAFGVIGFSLFYTFAVYFSEMIKYSEILKFIFKSLIVIIPFAVIIFSCAFGCIKTFKKYYTVGGKNIALFISYNLLLLLGTSICLVKIIDIALHVYYSFAIINCNPFTDLSVKTTATQSALQIKQAAQAKLKTERDYAKFYTIIFGMISFISCIFTTHFFFTKNKQHEN